MALLFAAAFACYWPSLNNGFVWDDTALVLRDPFIRSWRLIPEGFRHFLFTDATPSNFYRPIQRLTYTLDYQLFAFEPRGWHFGSIVFHALAGVMLFLLAEKMIERFGGGEGRARSVVPLIVALAWIVHPVHNAAVCYVSGRADLLAAMFGFAGLFFALKSEDEPPRRGLRAVAGLCFLLAMLSKESGAMILVIWLLIAWRGFGDDKKIDEPGRNLFAKLRPSRVLAPWLVVAVIVLSVYCTLRFSAEKQAPPPPKPVPVSVRPILFARAVAEYAGLLVAPVNLHMERELTATGGEMKKTLAAANRREYQTLLGVALIAALAAWMLRSRRDNALAFVCLVAAVVAYLPISNITPLNANVAEHWLYVPSAFLLLAAAASIARTRLANPAAILALIWIAGLGARTCARNFDWKDQRTFFTATIRDGGDSARMFDGLGSVETVDGNHDAAIAAYQEALKRDPGDPFALLNLANAFTRKKDFAHARELLEKAQQSKLMHDDAMVALAVTDFQENKRDRTDLLREAARHAPDEWDVNRRYILHLDETGRTLEAIQETRKILEVQWWRAESWRLFGWLLGKAGSLQKAEIAYQQAADYDVHDKDSRAKLAALRAAR